MKKSALCLGLTGAFAIAATAAMAGGIPGPTAPLRVPEPGTFGMIAGAAVAMIIAARVIRRK